MLLTAEQATVARRIFAHAHNPHDRVLLLEALGFRPVNGIAAGKLCAAGCGTLLHAGKGRHLDDDWWCGKPACHAQMRRVVRQRATGRPVHPRPVDTCERCKGPYRPVPGRNSPYRLCSKTIGCRRERRRRAGQDQRHPQKATA